MDQTEKRRPAENGAPPVDHAPLPGTQGDYSAAGGASKRPALVADREQIARFVSVLFRYADHGTFVSFRGYGRPPDAPPDAKDDPWWDTLRPCPYAQINGTTESNLIGGATDIATQLANRPGVWVFSPPVCTFTNSKRADERSLANGLALTVECDQRPREARLTLEEILGAATLITESGGEWVNPETGEAERKCHIYWRLKEPTRTPEAHSRLKQAREMATELIGADKTNKPIVHPLRWPGSWHTKNPKAPRLARIAYDWPEREIDLDDAWQRLRAAGGAEAAHIDLVCSRRERSYWCKLSEGVAKGTSGRINAITSVFGYLLSRGVEAHLAAALTRGYNAVACYPPLPDQKVEEAIYNIAKSELEGPVS